MRLLSVNPVTNIPHRMLSHEEPRRQRSLHGSRSCRLTSQNKQGQEWWLYDPMISPPSPGPLSVCDTGPPLDTCNISPFPFLHKPMRPFPNMSSHRSVHTLLFIVPTSLMPALLADPSSRSSRVARTPARASSRWKSARETATQFVLPCCW